MVRDGSAIKLVGLKAADMNGKTGVIVGYLM